MKNIIYSTTNATSHRRMILSFTNNVPFCDTLRGLFTLLLYCIARANLCQEKAMGASAKQKKWQNLAIFLFVLVVVRNARKERDYSALLCSSAGTAFFPRKR